MSKPLIIIAQGLSSLVDCPFDIETWGTNTVYRLAGFSELLNKFRLDKLFIADPLYCPLRGIKNYDIEEMNALDIPIVSLHKIQGLKAGLYPYKKITEHFKTDYFTGSIDYVIAYALYQGYDELNCYGFTFDRYDEWMEQKGGIEYWLGRAEERGCKVYIAPPTSIKQNINKLPYGFF